MKTKTMSPETKRPQPQLETQKKEQGPRISAGDPSIKELIHSARSQAKYPKTIFVWVLPMLSAMLLWASFTPLDWGALGWVALVPLVMLIRNPQRIRKLYLAIYIAGLINGLMLFQWMRLGDVTMYPAWIALSILLGFYFPVFVAVSRVAVHRFRIPLAVTVPVVWVGLEYFRAHFLTGCPWYFLGHSQYRWLEIIQISDLVGAYGVSFLLCIAAAAFVALLPASIFRKLKLTQELEPSSASILNPSPSQKWGIALSTLAVFGLALGYGIVRRNQADFEPGPRVALIQGNFSSSVKHDPTQQGQIFNMHRRLTGYAILRQPDLIVWPETMYPYQLNEIDEDVSDKQIVEITNDDPHRIRDYAKGVKSSLVDRSREAGADMIFGINTRTIGSDGAARFNSALLVKPDLGIQGRYDKMHRVPFGEYLPLKDWMPWLAAFSPYTGENDLSAGKEAVVFESRGWRFAPIICFEDTIPHLVRGIANSYRKTANDGSKIDFFVNLTNDGWFQNSSEQDQHLITAAFRCVETRTPMVRAVNTGVSAFIDGDGAIVTPEHFIDDNGREITFVDPKTGRWRKSVNAALVHHVPLDHRSSLYVKWGDWFAGSCLWFIVGVIGIHWLPRRMKRAAR